VGDGILPSVSLPVMNGATIVPNSTKLAGAGLLDGNILSGIDISAPQHKFPNERDAGNSGVANLN
jgi:hypothetical protein